MPETSVTQWRVSEGKARASWRGVERTRACQCVASCCRRPANRAAAQGKCPTRCCQWQPDSREKARTLRPAHGELPSPPPPRRPYVGRTGGHAGPDAAVYARELKRRSEARSHFPLAMAMAKTVSNAVLKYSVRCPRTLESMC